MKFFANMAIMAIVTIIFVLLAVALEDQLGWDCKFFMGWVGYSVYSGLKYKK